MSDLSQYSPEELEELVNSGQFLSSRGNDGERSEPTSAIRQSLPPSLERTESPLAVQDGKKAFVEVKNSDKSIPESETRTTNESSSRDSDSQQAKLQEPTRADGFDIKDPVELLFLLDENVQSGKITLYDWQIQFMLDFAAGGLSDEKPFQALVRACNGSGKDKYVIAPCVVWLCMAYIKARGVVTSSSGKQLDSQTCTYIDMLCNEANRKIAPGIWKLNYRYYECLATGSPIECFATDEAGKAEGFHPLEYGRKMGMFMSEAKTVPDEVNIAFNKCTGYTHRAHVSTPGIPLGHFYEYCQRSPYRRDFKSLDDVSPIDYIQYHVTAYDCGGHIRKNYIEQMKRDLNGEGSPAFKSQVLAEFGTTDEMVVIPHHFVWQAVNANKIGHLQEKFNTAGLDLSDGGDETVLSVRNGNKVLAVIAFKYDDTTATKTFLKKKFSEYSLDHPEALIWADAGGLGKPIIDDLRAQGYRNIQYVLNQERAFDPRVYVNRGTEMWFNFRKHLESGELIVLRDDKLIVQLTTRFYKITPDNRHKLEAKLEARAKGHPSPDRADATVLSFCRYKSKLDKPVNKAPFEAEKQRPIVKPFTQKEWANGDNLSKEAILNPSRKKDFTILRDEIKQYNERRKLLVN